MVQRLKGIIKPKIYMHVYYVLQLYVFKPLSPLCLEKAHISINNTSRLDFQL